ncbi:MAG: hypothetical protein JW947_04225 [Sedimentisphaerales bacterium]|nr:hypothetical protein [Sedimentisphaerales bacterium]
MTNREIKKHKQELVTIKTGLNIIGTESLEQRLTKLHEGIKKLQNLADIVGAYKYLGTGLRDFGEMLTLAKQNQSASRGTPLLVEKYEEYDTICKKIHDNILYKLQTEEMFNACVFAKWSCLFAAVAAIVAFISVILTMYLN